MAKHQIPPSGKSKFKIFYIEGDFASGDIPTLAQALTAAVRQPVAMKRIAAPNASADNGNGALETDDELLDAEALDIEDAELEEAAPITKGGTSKPRSYKKPKPVNMDMNGDGKSFKDFIAEKGPVSHRDKYLTIAAWLHDHGKPKVDAITADHVWTCYIAANWTFDVKDPSQVLRDLKREGKGDMKGGKFEINHLGLAAIKEMKPTA